MNKLLIYKTEALQEINNQNNNNNTKKNERHQSFLYQSKDCSDVMQNERSLTEAVCINVCCIHRSVDWESKAGWHESEQMLKKDISGGLGFVEVTEVMLRSVLSSTGQIKNNNPQLSESSD